MRAARLRALAGDPRRPGAQELTRRRAEEALRRRMEEAKAKREEEARRRNSRRTGGGFVVQFDKVGDKAGHGGGS